MVWNDLWKRLQSCVEVNQLDPLSVDTYTVHPGCSWSWTWQAWASFKRSVCFVLSVPAESQFSRHVPAGYDKSIHGHTHHCMVSDQHKHMTPTYYKSNTSTTSSMLPSFLSPHLSLEICCFYLGFHFLLPFYLNRSLIIFSKDYSYDRLKLFLWR